MGFMDKMKDLVGITDDYDDDYDNISQEEIDAYKRELSGSSAPAASSAAAVAAPEPPLSTGISPLAFSEVAPPQKFTENKDAADKISRNDSSAFKMVVIEPKNIGECRKLSTTSELTSRLSSTSKRLRPISRARCSISSAELHMLLRAASRE